MIQFLKPTPAKIILGILIFIVFSLPYWFGYQIHALCLPRLFDPNDFPVNMLQVMQAFLDALLHGYTNECNELHEVAANAVKVGIVFRKINEVALCYLMACTCSFLFSYVKNLLFPKTNNQTHSDKK